MNIPRIAVIGAGNMGSCIISGLIKNGHPADKLWASNPSKEKLTLLQEQFHIHITHDNKEAAEKAEVIILAIKPIYFTTVAKEIAATVAKHKPLIISIAAGVREANIREWMGNNIAIVRAMPNIPALIGCGATAMHANAWVTAEQHSEAESILRSVGITLWVADEAKLDIVTALSGSGPAYFFLVMEALEETAQELGLEKETAHLLTVETCLGAARMALETNTSFEHLRHRVTSPGGTTEKALAVLEEGNIRQVFRKALQAAKLRSEELASKPGEKSS